MKKIIISICMGSSCYLRGNRELTELLSNFLAEKSLEDYVEFVGNLCEDECKCGPNVRINDILITKASIKKVSQEILRQINEEV
jgi:NADH:ubiquinone oxidoreductase subunit E